MNKLAASFFNLSRGRVRLTRKLATYPPRHAAMLLGIAEDLRHFQDTLVLRQHRTLESFCAQQDLQPAWLRTILYLWNSCGEKALVALAELMTEAGEN